jgi:hypothetical protein
VLYTSFLASSEGWWWGGGLRPSACSFNQGKISLILGNFAQFDANRHTRGFAREIPFVTKSAVTINSLGDSTGLAKKGGEVLVTAAGLLRASHLPLWSFCSSSATEASKP